MSILVDTSIWIEYFRNGNNFEKLDEFIDENIVVTNDLILSELIPFLRLGNQRKLIALLQQVRKLPLVVNWEQLSDYQYQCLKIGINGIGIPDLIIGQNALQNHCAVYSLDNHFKFLAKILNIGVLGI